MVKRCVALALLLFSNACIIHANNPPPSNNSGYYGPSGSGGYAPYAAGSRVQVLWKGSWYPAVVRQTSGNKSLVHYTGYSSSWDEWVSPGRIRADSGPAYSPPPAGPAYSPPPSSAYYSPGSRVQVLWKGSWYNAVVLKVSGNSYYIHYDGYSNSWNEWVGPSRIR